MRSMANLAALPAHGAPVRSPAASRAPETTLAVLVRIPSALAALPPSSDCGHTVMRSDVPAAAKAEAASPAELQIIVLSFYYEMQAVHSNAIAASSSLGTCLLRVLHRDARMVASLEASMSAEVAGIDMKLKRHSSCARTTGESSSAPSNDAPIASPRCCRAETNDFTLLVSHSCC